MNDQQLKATYAILAWATKQGAAPIPAKEQGMMQDPITGEIVGFKPMVVWDGIERRNTANARVEKLSQFYRRFNDVSPK